MTDIENMTEAEMDSAINQAHYFLDRIKQTRDAQPERLAKARAAAEEARGWSLIEEPWADHVMAIPAHNAEGERTGNAIALPNLIAKEVWGARLAFDILDCGDDQDRITEVQGRYFKMVEGDTGLAFLLAMSALATIADTVVPQLLDEIETRGSNYDERVRLCEARAKAWSGRVAELRHTEGDAAAHGVTPIDGYDIGSNALDPDETDSGEQ
jgi:hypothetical protein